jgi:hypothetical protein
MEAVAGQPTWVGDVLEQVATEHRPCPKRLQQPNVVRIAQIGLGIDTWQCAHVHMDNFDTAGAQRVKHLLGNPRLHPFADFARTAAEIEQR